MDATWVAVVVLLLYSVLSIAAIAYIPWLQAGHLAIVDRTERAKLENEFRRTVLQIAGGFGIILSLFFTWRTLAFNEKTKATEHYLTLVQSLDSNQESVRLGAIRELAAMADDNPARRQQIYDSMSFWMRAESIKPAANVQTRRLEFELALRVMLGTYDSGGWSDPRDDSIILSGVDLREMNLTGLNFSNVNLSGSNLSKADLSHCDLRHADLSGAKLAGTRMFYSNCKNITFDQSTVLSDCDLQGADFEDARLIFANFSNAQMQNANLKNANLEFADLKDAQGIKQSDFATAQNTQNATPPRQFRQGG